MKFVTSVGHDPQVKRRIEEHFKGLLMSVLRVGDGGQAVLELNQELRVKYGAMLRGEDHRADLDKVVVDLSLYIS